MRDLYAVFAIAQRDLVKFLRDRPRLVTTLIFPLVFIGVLGGSLQANLGLRAGFNFLVFTFTGVLAQSLFQSASQGVISLIDDRENDFSQEMFVSPISRYAIVVGKILGESLVALPQGIAIVIFGLLIGVRMGIFQLIGMVLAAIIICLFGASFGLLVLSNLSSQRMANQIFPFIILPQFFLAGIFNPIKVLPPWLEALSRISPMRYAVDLMRGTFYLGSREYPKVVLDSPLLNLAVLGIMGTAFVVVGTALFVRGERTR